MTVCRKLKNLQNGFFEILFKMNRIEVAMGISHIFPTLK
jgi:hypothetical protein